MRCKDFVFLQSSGQIATMPWWQRTSTLTHVWICRHCRSFRQNDELLSDYVEKLKAHWDASDQSVK
ncbi:MAG: hypothetical protein FGM56_00545 [Limnohabitans sp.]|nr:hypothetical protein [Limnohabitans sp.]